MPDLLYGNETILWTIVKKKRGWSRDRLEKRMRKKEKKNAPVPLTSTGTPEGVLLSSKVRVLYLFLTQTYPNIESSGDKTIPFPYPF